MEMRTEAQNRRWCVRHSFVSMAGMWTNVMHFGFQWFCFWNSELNGGWLDTSLFALVLNKRSSNIQNLTIWEVLKQWFLTGLVLGFKFSLRHQVTVHDRPTKPSEFIPIHPFCLSEDSNPGPCCCEETMLIFHKMKSKIHNMSKYIIMSK